MSIEFDDNILTQFQTLAVLEAHGMRAMFYINSGLTPNDFEWRMDWAQMRQLSAAGMEVGGHSWDHADLTLPGTNLNHEICDDRTNIQAHGLPLPTDFAYPTAPTRRVASGGGRRLRLHNPAYRRRDHVVHLPDRMPVRESIPPLDPYQTRTVRRPDQRLAREGRGLRDAGRAARGGWVQPVFHDLCATNCAATTTQPRRPCSPRCSTGYSHGRQTAPW